MNVFNHQANDGHEQIHFFQDKQSGLKAIIALHDTRLGPAAGGCRFFPYQHEEAALRDVLRLSQGMTYKSALANLPLGGGKAVIIGDPRTDKTRHLLTAMADSVESLNGQYYTSIDAGTSLNDIAVMAESTRYVVGLDHSADGLGPSASTALGVFNGLRAAVSHRLGTSDLSGLRVAIQGVGHVGLQLARHLCKAGARVFVSDVSAAPLQRAVDELNVEILPNDEILTSDVDVVAPCALGAVITHELVDAIRAPVISGAANNQLVDANVGERLRRSGILYAPDFVINAGGIIDAWYYHPTLGAQSQTASRPKQLGELLDGIGNTLTEIFERAEGLERSTEAVAISLARERLRHSPHVSDAA